VTRLTSNVIANIRHTVTGKTHRAYANKLEPVDREDKVAKV